MRSAKGATFTAGLGQRPRIHIRKRWQRWKRDSIVMSFVSSLLLLRKLLGLFDGAACLGIGNASWT